LSIYTQLNWINFDVVEEGNPVMSKWRHVDDIYLTAHDYAETKLYYMKHKAKLQDNLIQVFGAEPTSYLYLNQARIWKSKDFRPEKSATKLVSCIAFLFEDKTTMHSRKV
jgi:hypothetical protein